ncbi:MAG: GNAT family N-acetyltransferase [Crocinitomicaceae bacterium]|jgi:GNAT superfamily N-acetyltransferase|nr:GNAT family N-acetyltransferase [Crocinitomicaceae bacterium]
MMIRNAERKDVQEIHQLIVELAIYEKEPEAVTNRVEDLEKHLFDEEVCSAIVAEKEGQIIGFALYYISYSTWKGKCLYLEDFYVQPEHRKTGAGTELFEEVIRRAKQMNAARMDWQVLEWNELAINFYKKFDAELNPEWLNGRFHFSA